MGKIKTEKYSPKWLLEKVLENENNPAKAILFILEFQNALQEQVKNNIPLAVVSNQRELLIAFNNEFAKYQNAVPSKLKVKWNGLLESNL